MNKTGSKIKNKLLEKDISNVKMYWEKPSPTLLEIVPE